MGDLHVRFANLGISWVVEAEDKDCHKSYHCVVALGIMDSTIGSFALALSHPGESFTVCDDPGQEFLYGIAHAKDYIVPSEKAKEIRERREFLGAEFEVASVKTR